MDAMGRHQPHYKVGIIGALNMNKKSIQTIMLLAFLVMFVLSSCNSQNTATLPAEQDSGEPMGIVSQGRLMPASNLDLAFKVPGQVAEVLVKSGDMVTKGQVLARLDNLPEAQAVLARANQELLSARQSLDTLTDAGELNLAQAELAAVVAQEKYDEVLSKYEEDVTSKNRVELELAAVELETAQDRLSMYKQNNGIDPAQLDLAQGRIIAAEASVASAQAAVGATELKAPLDGMVVDMDLLIGQSILAGQPVMTISDYSFWVVKTDNLTEFQVINVKVGQKVVVVLDALPDLSISGEVIAINSRYEEKRGDITYTLTARIDQAEPQMRWGMTAAVQFIP